MKSIEKTAAAIARNFHWMEDELRADFMEVVETTNALIADAAAEFGIDFDDMQDAVYAAL